MLKLPKLFWLLTFSCAITYMSIVPYIQTVTKLLQVKYNFSNETAGALQGIPWYFSAIFAPLLGQLVDKSGKRGQLIILSSVILMAGHFISMSLGACNQCYSEVYPLLLISVGYSIYASTMWASIPFTVPKSVIGTAYGVAECIQMLGLAIAPVAVACIHDHTLGTDFGFYWPNVFLLSLNVIGLIVAVQLYRLDLNSNSGMLDRVTK